MNSKLRKTIHSDGLLLSSRREVSKKHNDGACTLGKNFGFSRNFHKIRLVKLSVGGSISIVSGENHLKERHKNFEVPAKLKEKTGWS